MSNAKKGVSALCCLFCAQWKLCAGKWSPVSRENTYDCGYTISCRSQWKLGLTAFVEASEALSSVCCGVEGGKENRINGMCPQCLLSLSTYMVMPPWVNCCARNDLWKTEISSVGAAEHPMLDEREVLEVTVTTAESHKARWKWTGCAGSYYFVCVMKHRGWWMQ